MTTIGKGWLFLAVGLLAVSSEGLFRVLEFNVGQADFISGFGSGLAVIMFGAAIFFLVKSTRGPH